MVVYQGIQLVYTHVMQLLNAVTNWFTDLDVTVWINSLPTFCISFVSVFFSIMLVMAIIGLVKKLSFMLG